MTDGGIHAENHFTSSVARVVRRDDSHVQIKLPNHPFEIYGQIKYFVKDETQLYVVLNPYHVNDLEYIRHSSRKDVVLKHLKPVKKSGLLLLLRHEDIISMSHVADLRGLVGVPPFRMKRNL